MRWNIVGSEVAPWRVVDQLACLLDRCLHGTEDLDDVGRNDIEVSSTLDTHEYLN